MKIAVATRDAETVTGHYGKARAFAVLQIGDGAIIGREIREKPRRRADGSPSGGEHRGGHGRRAAELIADCDVVIAGGMGRNAAEHLRAAGIDIVLTDVRNIDEAVLGFVAGEVAHLEDRFHDSEKRR